MQHKTFLMEGNKTKDNQIEDNLTEENKCKDNKSKSNRTKDDIPKPEYNLEKLSSKIYDLNNKKSLNK